MGPNEHQPWSEALGRASENWLDGPFRYNDEGELLVGDKPVVANPACRFGAQKGEKLSAVDDIERSSTNGATFLNTPINLPSCAHVAHTCCLYYLKGDRRPLATAKADHADARGQLLVATKDELTAAISLRNPVDGLRYGFLPHTQLCGSTAAVFHYVCLSRVIASVACRALKTPREGYYDDFGMVLPE